MSLGFSKAHAYTSRAETNTGAIFLSCLLASCIVPRHVRAVRGAGYKVDMHVRELYC